MWLTTAQEDRAFARLGHPPDPLTAPAPPSRGYVPLFTYGSLMRGGVHDNLLPDCPWLGPALTAEAAFVLWCQGPYPYLRETVLPLATPQGGRLSPARAAGEVYRIPVDRVLLLDRFEDHPTIYYRHWRPVRLADGQTLWAWMYLYLGPIEDLHPRVNLHQGAYHYAG